MSCSPFDLRDYFLKELVPEERGFRWMATGKAAWAAVKSWTGCS